MGRQLVQRAGDVSDANAASDAPDAPDAPDAFEASPQASPYQASPYQAPPGAPRPADGRDWGRVLGSESASGSSSGGGSGASAASFVLFARQPSSSSSANSVCSGGSGAGRKRRIEQSLYPGGLSPAQQIAMNAVRAAADRHGGAANANSAADDPLRDSPMPIVFTRRRRGV